MKTVCNILSHKELTNREVHVSPLEKNQFRHVKSILLITLLLISFSTTAQVNFSDQNIIIQSETNFSSVYSVDIDGDGDMDVLSASISGDKIAWYQNTDGQGAFGTEQIITTNAGWAHCVYATDIDGDGDMDVLSASLNDNKIAWYENTDGQGTFGSQQIITTNADWAYSVYAADIDGDGDMDVLSASAYDNKIVWYENTDGQGTFLSIEQTITTSANSTNSVYATDIDGDGDMDVLWTSSFYDKIVWQENIDGQGTFGTHKNITTNANGANSVYATDIDGDGDMDVLSASYYDNKIAWYENTDGQGAFGSQQIITTNADGAISVYATDIDGDGDMDVLSASMSDDKIAWYENIDGQGAFGLQQIITTNADGAESVYATDIDGDGDMDVLSASYDDNKIAWYENMGVIGIEECEIFSDNLNIFPNPTFKKITIQIDEMIQSVTIYNLLGKKVKQVSAKEINVSELSVGTYIVRITSNNGEIAFKKLVKY